MGKRGHSEKYLTQYRDYWYNKDFLDLMAKRWNLEKYSSMLDIGCGLCHWSKLLVQYLKPNAKVTALDKESKWLKNTKEIKTYFKSFQSQIKFLKGDAHNLPFEENSFDIVTCQTVLIHLRNPERTLSEMKRVVKTNGIVICAEPNNRTQSLIQDSITQNDSIENILDNVKYSLAYERGKIKNNEGDSSFGDLLSGVMNLLGFVNIQSYLNDKTVPLYPPYERDEQKVTIATHLKWQKEEEIKTNIENKIEKTYFSSLGKNYMTFLNRLRKKNSENRMLNKIKTGEFRAGGASLMYLVSGKK